MTRYKITILRIIGTGPESREEKAKEVVTWWEDMASARLEAIYEAANVFMLMKDIHKHRDFSGVRFVVQEVTDAN